MGNKKSVDFEFKKDSIKKIQNISKESPDIFEDRKKVQPTIGSYTSKSVLYREKATIPEWRAALQQAECSTPTYWRLIKLYREAELDADVTALCDLRINNVMSRSFNIIKNGVKSEELTEYFKKSWFTKWKIETLKSILFGYSVLKFGDIINDEIQDIISIQREYYNPLTEQLLFRYTDMKGKDVNDDDIKDWLLVVTPYSKESYYEGLYSKICPYFITLRNSLNSFSDYIRRTASGSIIMQLDLADEKSKKNAEEYAKNFSSANYALIGLDDKINFLDANGKGSQAYKDIMQECKNAISKILLGTDTIATEKAFVGSAMIAASQSHLYSKADITFIENQFDCLIDKMVALGIKSVANCKLEIDKTNLLDLQQEFTVITSLLATGQYEVTDDNFFQDRFGIPIKKIKGTDVQL